MNSVKASACSVHGVFSQYALSIPRYQRPYVWGDSATVLLRDVRASELAAREGEADEYFIGNVLLVRNEEGTQVVFDVVDGQQRLTTLLIALAQLRQRLARVTSADKALAWLDTGLVRHPDLDETVSVLGSPRVDVAEALLCIARTGCPPELAQDQKAPSRVLAGYHFVSTAVAEWLADELADDADVLAFTRYLLKKVKLVVIEYPDASTALAVFESMNSKANQLIQSDLLKSEFMKADPSGRDWALIDDTWSQLLEGATSRKGGIDGFLRKSSIAMVFPAFDKPTDFPRASELLKRLREHWQAHSLSTAQVLSHLKRFADAQTQLEAETPCYPGGGTDTVLQRIKRMPSRPEFVHTLLACVPAGFHPSSKELIARVVEAVAAHVALSRQSKNINYRLQPFYVALRDLPETQLPGYLTKLLDQVAVPLEPAFCAALRTLRIENGSSTQGKWAKYLLWVLESELRRGLQDSPLSFEGKKGAARLANVEHIVSKASPGAASERAVLSLGNCTLLEDDKNKSVQDKSFEDKRSVYASSGFRLTKELLRGDHGRNTQARLFLDQDHIRGVWDHATLASDSDIERRTEGLLRALLSYWSAEVRKLAGLA